MNLPNLITIFRLLTALPFAWCILQYNRNGEPFYYWASLGVFGLAAVSDGLDGLIARSCHLKTSLGAILDPLADKLFLNCAVILLGVGVRGLFRFPLWFVILVLGRDVVIVAGALLIRQARGGLEVAPNWLGKTAAVLQMALVIWVLFKLPRPEVALYLTAALTVASGLSYLRFGLGQLKGGTQFQNRKN